MISTIITFIEVFCGIVSWAMFGVFVAWGLREAWNYVMPVFGGPRIDMFIGFIAYMVLFALWLIFAPRLREVKEKAEEVQ